jgi:hypothetical protein
LVPRSKYCDQLTGVGLVRGESQPLPGIKADDFLRTAIADAQTVIYRLKGMTRRSALLRARRCWHRRLT